ncbi:MAG: HPF/RaiA family ribosome-associated protein, partial [Phycisphaerales bacterium JB038]
HVERCLRAALERHAPHIRRVEVVMTDINGPRGGRDQLCRVRVGLNRGGTLHMSKLGHDFYSNVNHLSSALKRAVARRLDRDRCRRS